MKQMMKLSTLVLLSVILSTGAYAQDNGKKPTAISRIFMKHHLKDGFEKPKRIVENPKDKSRSRDASGAQLVFPDRVWFPGEWEEVKAVVITPQYIYRPEDHKNDTAYYSTPLVKGYGDHYYLAKGAEQAEYKGSGKYVSILNMETNGSLIPLYIMDGIQKAGAEAWVHIENESDETAVRDSMTQLGLRTDHMKFFVAPGNSIWYRDCGPICFYYGDDDKLAMLDFLYYTDRPLDDLLPSYLHRKFGIPNYINDIIWEGGNCLVDGLGGLVTSTHTYAHNADTVGRLWWDGIDYKSIRYSYKDRLDKPTVKAALSGLLGQRQTSIVPMLNYDGGTGHVDLYADATDENSFLLAQMPEAYDFWTDYEIVIGNTAILLNKRSFFNRKYYDEGAIPFPSHDDGSKWESEEEYGRYARTYANHLICNNYIIQPCFSPVGTDGMPTEDWDRANIEKMKKLYPGYTFYCIDMRSFDGQGGSIHCITKQIPADNPIRIIHKDIHNKVNPGTDTAIPFSTIITNKSGIAEAKVFYRINNGDWSEAPLKANGNCWSGKVDLKVFTGGQPLTEEGIYVEYYIQATSNNGKTVTKPINAQYGSLYDFTLTNSVDYDENAFDYATEPIAKELITFELDTSWLYEDTTTDDETTGIIEVKRNVPVTVGWYTLGGLRLSSRPSAKGVYIFNGKKVVIK